MTIHELSSEASQSFCERCTQSEVIELINSAVHKLVCYKADYRAVHLTDIARHVLQPHQSIELNGVFRSVFINSGDGFACSDDRRVPLLPGVHMIYSDRLIIISGSSGLSFYDGTLERVSKHG